MSGSAFGECSLSALAGTGNSKLPHRGVPFNCGFLNGVGAGLEALAAAFRKRSDFRGSLQQIEVERNRRRRCQNS